MIPVVIGVAVVGLIVIALLARRSFKPPVPAGARVPPALRPGDTDDVLESSRLMGIQKWGLVLSFAFAALIFVYWLAEPSRMLSKEKQFAQASIDRGGYYFALSEDPETGKPPPKGTGRATGRPVECARCHGQAGKGGTNAFLDPNTGQKRDIHVPELQTVYARYEKPPPGYKDARTFIFETIERGRPGTDMPTWGNEYGGPLTKQQIKDIVDYLESIQKPLSPGAQTDGPTIFATFCSPCHGQSGAGGSGPAMRGGSESRQFPNVEDHIAFVNSGSKSGEPYGTTGKGSGGMPPWKGRLTDEQIKAVIEYERSL